MKNSPAAYHCTDSSFSLNDVSATAQPVYLAFERGETASRWSEKVESRSVKDRYQRVFRSRVKLSPIFANLLNYSVTEGASGILRGKVETRPRVARVST